MRTSLTLTGAMILALAGPVPAATLLHGYDFSSGVTDAVGGQHGSLLNGASVVGGVLLLDGVDDFVQFGSHLVPTSGSYSVALAARQDSFTGNYVELISQGYSGPGFYIGHDWAHQIRMTDLATNTGVAFGPVGAWNHYAMVVDASAGTSKLFVNGALAFTAPSAIVTTTLGDHTRLGTQFATHAEFLHGAIDNVRIYAGALSDGQVLALASSVPEPAGYALLLAGLAAVVVAARRREG